MNQFLYLLNKISDAPILEHPFEYLYIENFFAPKHFAAITSAQQIRLPAAQDIHDLIAELQTQQYSPEPFPGCTTSIDDYLSWYLSEDRTRRFEHGLLEGFGLAWRLRSYLDPILQEVIDFFNSKEFHAAIKKKFSRTGNTRVETAIQKYMSGYEISPHPDIRKKCLTYMININTHDETERLDLHTHLMQFDDQHQSVYEFWENHPRVDRCWVPWNWCQDVFQHCRNNSIVMFAPNNRSLHAVKLDYDQLQFQRTQIYGNLWYTKGYGTIDQRPTWRQLERMI